MKDITTSIVVPPYLFDWIVNKYGNPLRFPARSPHNDLLHALVAVAQLKKTPGDEERKRGMAINVVLPNRSRHKPEHYHHLSKEAKAVFVRDLKRFFRLDLVAFIVETAAKGRLTPQHLEQWCKRHGIRITHRDAVKRMYYRLKKNFEQQGILLPPNFAKNAALITAGIS